jgi:hypothetical protein
MMLTNQIPQNDPVDCAFHWSRVPVGGQTGFDGRVVALQTGGEGTDPRQAGPHGIGHPFGQAGAPDLAGID